jgi:hypothetical protein
VTLPGFIHGTDGEGSVIRRRPTTASVSSEGLPVAANDDETLTTCRVAELSARERADLGAELQDVDGVVLVPLGTDVLRGDLFVVTGLDAQLNGTWHTAAVQHTFLHLRCLTRRSNE